MDLSIASICFSSNIIFLILLIALSGVIGGVVNYFMIADDSEKLLLQKKEGQHAPTMKFVFWRCIAVGLGASILVPLFLQMISSNLVLDVLDGKVDKIFVFIGFCVVASIFSRRFIISIGEKLLKELEEAKQTANEAKEIAIESKEDSNDAIDALSEKDNYQEVDDVDASSEVEDGPTDKLIAVGQALKDAYVRVFEAFEKKPKLTYRTATGISIDADITLAQTKYILEHMYKVGYLKRRTKPERKTVLYGITEEGHKWKQKNV